MKHSKLLIVATLAAAALGANASEFDRPQGYKIGEHLTLRPYVSMSYTFDSNVDSSKKGKSGQQWMVRPGLGADYMADNWSIVGDVYYAYHGYNRYTSQLNSQSYGENLGFNWHNSMPNEKGWTVSVTEHFEQISQDDDMSNQGGRGYGRDRKEFNISGRVERRLNQNVHAGLDAGYYLLDYDNNVKKYAPLYGWKRTNVGGEVGYAASRWLDFIVTGDYQWYTQDNNTFRSAQYYQDVPIKNNRVSGDSHGWTVMGGIATRATERIDYRLLAGYSRFNYGNGVSSMGGFSYAFSSQYRIEDRLSLMILGSSYYQPSETQYGTASKVYTVSAGLAKSWVRGKVTTNFDVAYRKESTEYSEFVGNDMDQDIWTARIGLNYYLNRYVSFFTSFEYQLSDSNSRGYDYDRWRATLGMRLAY